MYEDADLEIHEKAALIEVGVPEIRLTNRTRARAEAIKADFGAKITVQEWVQAPAMLQGAVTVVNTTALGMTGKSDFNVPLDTLPHTALVTDIVYTPLMTQFLIAARDRGCTVVDPPSVLTTHLTELVKQNMAELLSFAETQKLLRMEDELHKRVIGQEAAITATRMAKPK